MKIQMKILWSELVRRKVLRTGAAYGAVAFVTLQLGEIMFPAYGVGQEGMRALITGLIAASPLALAASWVYDVSAPAVRRTPEWRPIAGEAPEARTPPVSAILIVVVTAVALGGATWWVLGGMAGTNLLLISLPSILASLAALFAVGWCSVARRASQAPSESRSVAVLPFLAWGSSDGGDLGEALAEEIRVRLQREHGLLVAARESSCGRATNGDVRALGRHLGVATVMEGSLIRRGSEVRVSAHLVDTGSGFRVAAQSWAFDLSDAPAAQERMAETIVGGLLNDGGGRRPLRAV